MILGKHCTRGCRFCNVSSSKILDPVDPEEPQNIAFVVKQFNLDYIVITSVTRDDLIDQGVNHYLKTVEQIKNISPGTNIELLIPDFNADLKCIEEISNSKINVIGHNIEMVPELYSTIRPDSNYECSLEILRLLKKTNSNIFVKSGIMVGLGETRQQLISSFKDIADIGVDIFYIGQYLQPTLKHVKVEKYYTPKEFKDLEHIVKDFGIKVVKSDPMIRSSYKAKEAYLECLEG